MKRYFYREPLEAAYMWNTFEMEFTTFHGVNWRYDPEDDFPEHCWQIIDESDKEHIYIRPDSLALLEPQVGDIWMTPVNGRSFLIIEKPTLDTLARTIEQIRGWIEQGHAKIIMRQSKHFFFPES